jgi:lipopolysaccharide export system permease protein
MKILDRYIIQKVLSTFFFVVLILSAIIVAIDLTEKIDKFSKNNLSSAAILQYYGDFIPWIAGLLTPITVFISIVYVTSRLAAHTEIIAMLSGGMSFNRLLLPYFISAAIIAGITFFLNGWIIPRSNQDRLSFEMQYLKNRFYYDKRNIHMQIQPNVYLYMNSFNNQSNIGYQFSLERFDENRLMEKLTADHIQWDSVKQGWTLNYWTYRKVDDLFQTTGLPASGHKKTGQTMDTVLAITPTDFANDDRKYDGMTIPELSEHIEKLRFRGSTGVEVFEVERDIRYAAPFTIFILVFMGVIVSARKSRGGTGFQIALGFFLSFVFILFFMLTRTFAEAGSLTPAAAAWLPNSVFALLSLGMYRYVPR